ncbi:hypothetical protein [Lactococcus chungangensis]|uniref:hypothetical protein n=1 Tax=Pseudolactococcus chungangensis TaxID=451457 RepID=UPI003736D44F
MILLNILSSALRDLERVFLRQVKSSAPFDIDAIEAAGYSTQTPVIVMNTPSYEQINVTDKQTVSGQDMLLVTVSFVDCLVTYFS